MPPRGNGFSTLVVMVVFAYSVLGGEFYSAAAAPEAAPAPAYEGPEAQPSYYQPSPPPQYEPPVYSTQKVSSNLLYRVKYDLLNFTSVRCICHKFEGTVGQNFFTLKSSGPSIVMKKPNSQNLGSFRVKFWLLSIPSLCVVKKTIMLYIELDCTKKSRTLAV